MTYNSTMQYSHESPRTDDGPENTIDALFEGNVPLELRPIWERLIWDGDPPADAALERLQELLAQRVRALAHEHAKKYLIQDRVCERNKEDAERIKEDAVRVAKSIIERDDNIIGTGGTGRVHTSERHPGICYKFIFNAGEEYTAYNDVLEEERITNIVRDLEVEGTRCPKTILAFSIEGISVLVLEKLNAITLKQAIQNPGSIPENFNPETFFSKLESYITAMHNTCRVHHRDLHDSNIMIDLETGDPRVIDFGRSVDAVLGNDDPYTIRDAHGNVIKKYINDLSQIEAHKIALRNALKCNYSHPPQYQIPLEVGRGVTPME